MQMNFNMDEEFDREVSIKVIGVGGGGGNAVNRMVLSGMKGVEFLSMNTDAQALRNSRATHKLNIGVKLTRGYGAGGQPDKGQRAAEENRDEIAAALKGTDMVFITAGMGGGTGTGAAPVVAEIAQEMGILTIGIVTKPFEHEGNRRMEQAVRGIAVLHEHVDALLVIPNERLHQISHERITLKNAFVAADEILRQGVQSLSDLITITGEVNLDFADICAILKEAGYAHMGVGRASGKDKAKCAAEMAISSPLLETSINGAKGVIVNITSDQDVGLDEVTVASKMVQDAAHPDANIMWGVVYDDNLKDEMIVTVVATGFESDLNFSVPAYDFVSPAKETPKPDLKGNVRANVQPNNYQPAAAPRPAGQAPAAVKDAEPNQEEAKTQPQQNHQSAADDEDWMKILDIFNRKK